MAGHKKWAKAMRFQDAREAGCKKLFAQLAGGDYANSELPEDAG